MAGVLVAMVIIVARKGGGLQVGSTACWGAGSDTNSRDASCADGLVCARNGEDGRNFGCQGYHCCFENSKFSRWRIIPRDETWWFRVKELKIQARDGISGRPIASGNGNYLAAFDYDQATFWKGEGDCMMGTRYLRNHGRKRVIHYMARIA